MAKSNIITQTTSLLKETNKFANKLGIKQLSLPKKQNSESYEKQAEVLLPPQEEKQASPIVIDTVEGAKAWLTSMESTSSSTWLPVIKQQLAILGSIDSPTMNRLLIGNIFEVLNDSLAASSNEAEKKELRKSVISMINNYVFLSEAKLRIAINRNREEARQLLSEAGNMLSSSLSSMANAAMTGGTSIVMGNILNSAAADPGFFSRLGSFFGSKKIIEEKENEFFSFIENIFDTFDRRADILGQSIAINEMLAGYRKKLVDRFAENETATVKSLMPVSDINNLERVTEELADSLSKANKKGIITAVSGFVKTISSFVIDKNVRKKAAQMDVHSFCLLWDSCEKEISDLKTEIAAESASLNELRMQRKEIGMLNFSQKKTSQATIDEQISTLNRRREALTEAESKLEQMKKLFPQARSIKQKIDAYEANLVQIENKFK